MTILQLPTPIGTWLLHLPYPLTAPAISLRFQGEVLCHLIFQGFSIDDGALIYRGVATEYTNKQHDALLYAGFKLENTF